MRVAGRAGEVTVEEYADLVAEQVRAGVKKAFAAAPAGEAVLPDPASIATSMEDIIGYLPDDSPNELAGLLAPFWSGAKVRSAWRGISRQALAERRKSGSVLGLKTSDHEIVYPVFQFQRRADRIEVKPALVPVLRALRGFDPWTVAVFLRTPAPELGSLTPLDWVRRDRPAAALLDLAQVVAREWSAGAA